MPISHRVNQIHSASGLRILTYEGLLDKPQANIPMTFRPRPTKRVHTCQAVEIMTPTCHLDHVCFEFTSTSSPNINSPNMFKPLFADPNSFSFPFLRSPRSACSPLASPLGVLLGGRASCFGIRPVQASDKRAAASASRENFALD